ncbi:2-succinylbenzoate--CoA ligase [Staphylococcus carnosus]|uniref:o-succinylbenzoate--CoA ligase n=1 Tax=Staphylococcus carnosus TaxID=1281 RepID=UPI0006AB97E7|nr:o-succinylbenzoate--CoA ligase [Staphylococcus carnosus]KOR13359.1 2-succinylbenzoate--CoA ligase [Staphylococcus carnosus]UTB80410.1 O-succinylbenzoate-CoA ligase [Staphylococcus carnosus]
MDLWLKQSAEKVPENIALEDHNTQLTYMNVYKTALQYAHVLHQLNRKRIAFYIDNRLDSALIIYGAWLAGIEAVMINTRLTDKEITAQLKSVDTDTIIAILPLNIDGFNIISWSELEAKRGTETYEIPMDLERIASIMFTSGTTGPQKAVPQTFNNHLASATGCKESLGFDQNTKWLSVLPIYHISGLSVLLRSMIEGFTVRIVNKFDADQILEIIKGENITHISLVPQTLKWMMDAGLTEPYHLEKILLGGAKLSHALIEEALQNHLPIYNSFGMTETCSQFLTASPAMLKFNPDTVGKPSPNVDVKITKPNHEGHGELLIKGDNVINGYLYPKNLTDTFENGYFKTGDIAKIDSEDNVMIYDRRKDLIISGGENIYPFEIESAAKRYKNVNDAMCIGVEDIEWGQVPKLYYVSESDIDKNKLQYFLQQELAKYKVPKTYQRVDTLPYTSTGKLKRGSIEE